jgi:hypothetical protein
LGIPKSHFRKKKKEREYELGDLIPVDHESSGKTQEGRENNRF